MIEKVSNIGKKGYSKLKFPTNSIKRSGKKAYYFSMEGNGTFYINGAHEMLLFGKMRAENSGGSQTDYAEYVVVRGVQIIAISNYVKKPIPFIVDVKKHLFSSGGYNVTGIAKGSVKYIYKTTSGYFVTDETTPISFPPNAIVYEI